MSASLPTLPHPARHRLAAALLGLLAAALAVTVVLLLVPRSSEDAGVARPELQRVLDGLVAGGDAVAPGAVAYVSGPKGTWLGSAGVADVAAQEPMGRDARVRLESVSKIYTAALVLALDQDGLLDTGDTVERWLPGLLPDGSRITIRHLLTMRSGLVDNNDVVRDPDPYLARVGDDRLRAQLTALAERMSADPAGEFSPTWWIRLAAWQPLLFEPGTADHYSNIGYDVLGLIAARAGRASLPVLFRERIFEPLGLERTAYDPQGPIAGPHAKGYGLEGGQRVETTDVHAGIGAEGGIVADAEDTAAFLQALLGGRLLDEAHVARLRGADLWRGGDRSGCAGSAYGWSGGGTGYKTNVWVDARGARVAVLLLNGRHLGPEQRGADAAAASAMIRLYCAA